MFILLHVKYPFFQNYTRRVDVFCVCKVPSMGDDFEGPYKLEVPFYKANSPVSIYDSDTVLIKHILSSQSDKT